MSSSPRELELFAPAKLNLSLEVRGRRPDGFHEVVTTLLALDVGDRLRVASRADTEVRLEVAGPAASPDVPRGEGNLAWRAAQAVRELALTRGAHPAGLELVLQKHLPAGAGLGGGSADAAAAALGAALVLGIGPDDPELVRLLSELGSDCPFFLVARASGLARARGRGELVEPLPAPESERAFAVVTPACECRTADVYAAFDALPAGERGAPEAAAGFDGQAFFAADLEGARARLVNDLEVAALRSHPALGGWRTLLDEAGAGHARLAGSGSSFFALFADRRAAETALRDWIVRAKARDYGLRASFVAGPAGSAVTPVSSK